MRAETGLMKFGEDWCGVFIRGDNAKHFSVHLKAMLDGEMTDHKLWVSRAMLGKLRILLDHKRRTR